MNIYIHISNMYYSVARIAFNNDHTQREFSNNSSNSDDDDNTVYIHTTITHCECEND